ncbi:hypothetical protein AB0L40_13590 [Patulibacter sp. NPDC049589]
MTLRGRLLFNVLAMAAERFGIGRSTVYRAIEHRRWTRSAARATLSPSA